jgi:membrane protein
MGDHENTDKVEARTQAVPAAVAAQSRFSIARQWQRLRGLDARRLGALIYRAFDDWTTDGATRLGAALAYYTLFSVAPLLIVVTGIAGIVVGREAAHAELTPWLQRFLSVEGAQAADLMLRQRLTTGGGWAASLTGLAMLFLTTSTFVGELRQSLNLVWRVQAPPSAGTGVIAAARSMLSDRAYAFAVALGAALLLLLSFAVNTTVAVTAAHFDRMLPLAPSVLHAVNFAVTFLVLTAVFTLTYKIVPDAHVAWGDAWVGSIATALLFTVGSIAISLFIGTASTSPFGTAASVLALLSFVYYSAQVFLFGAVLTRLFATTYGGGIVPMHRALRRPRLRRHRRVIRDRQLDAG